MTSTNLPSETESMGKASSTSRKTISNFKKAKSRGKFMPSRYGVVKTVQAPEVTDKNFTSKPRINDQYKAAASSIFENEDVVVEMMQFLGVRSMVAFGSSSKSLREALGVEIKRRKNAFVTCRSRVKALLKDKNPSCANVISAKIIYHAAENLVDYELDFLEIPRHRFWCLPSYPFKDEAQQLMLVNPDSDDPPAFHMLPLCFYIPQNYGVPFQPSFQDLRLAMDRVLNIVGLQDCAMIPQNDPFYDNPKHPFRKFENHACSSFFYNILMIAVNSLKSDTRALESFRTAAREYAMLRPGAQDSLHFVLDSADQRRNTAEGHQLAMKHLRL